jgi:hypothetical protein
MTKPPTLGLLPGWRQYGRYCFQRCGFRIHIIVNPIKLFALPLWIALVYFIFRSKHKWRTAKLAIGSMLLCFLLMFAAISIIPVLDTRSFGTAMGYVSLFVGALVAFIYDH